MTAQVGGGGPLDQTDSMTPHLSVDQIAAFVDSGLAREERAQVEAHLAECDDCRSEVLEVTRIVRVRRRRRWFFLIPVAAAAAGLLLVVRPFSPSSGRRTVERGGHSGTPAAVSTIAPLPDAVLTSQRVAFVWHRAGAAASYRLTVTDAVGDVVWTGLSGDTAITIPDQVQLRPGQGYAWYVDVLLPDGSSSTSAVQRFRTAP